MDKEEVCSSLYIGSNNETGELEKDKAIKIIGSWYDSFTFITVKGYWKGKEESMLKIELYTSGGDINRLSIKKLSEELERELKQDKVLVVETLIKTNF